MSRTKDPVISAQVLLNPSSGKMPSDAEITADNIGKLKPAPEAVVLVRQSLERAGFEAGPVVGLGFSITARRSVFDQFFGTKLAGRVPGTIPLDRLPVNVRRALSAVVFPSPPDFGPGQFS
jgi:hypothetical protein